MLNFPKTLRFKGHLRHKTIPSQNVPSQAQSKNFFFIEKLCSILKIFKFLYQICDAMMSISTWDRVPF